ncbi:MAG: RtcB family protein [Acidobacteriota bacterium]
MRVDGIVYADDRLMETLRHDQALQQVCNVATLPGIVGASLAMPDIHWGYGFPIGGVAAFDPGEGVVSPGGVGFDINCGVRLLSTALSARDVTGRLDRIAESFFRHIPSGVGSHRKDIKLSRKDLAKVMRRGAGWAVREGYGVAEDLDHIEEKGALAGAEPDLVGDRAVARGGDQLGTIGSGNHFVELGRVDEIYDETAADTLGLAPEGVTVIVHTGSRGFGYQVCDDFLKLMLGASRKYGIELCDRQLCAAPLGSAEGRRYLAAMACAANFAFANRQIITHYVRRALEEALERPPRDLDVRLVYDVCHNIAKMEEHVVDGRRRTLCVHRKGATRAFPPGHPDTPADYRAIGQPVLIPGDMGRYSYVLSGTERAERETFGSTCHGAGRVMSRTQAKASARGRSIVSELAARGIALRAAGHATVAEEMPEAYKDVADVVDVVHAAGVSRKVARLRPLAVIKG